MLVFANEAANRVAALSAGADDAIEDGTAPDEWIARVRAIVRRSRGYSQAVLQHGPVCLCIESQAVTVDHQPVKLTRSETAVLQLLLLRKNSVLTKQAIMSHLYGGPDEPDVKIIDVFVCKTRRKLAEFGLSDVIRTVWGRGYQIGAADRTPQ